MAKRELIEADAKLYCKQLSGHRYEVEQFVFISEDINYTAKDIIDINDYDDDHIAYCCNEHGYPTNKDEKFLALAIFKEACQNGEYSPY